VLPAVKAASSLFTPRSRSTTDRRLLTTDPRRRRSLIELAILLLVISVTVAHPGDVSWINDEPRLIAAAWHANHDGALATGGLYGNFGIRYGPLATHVYQALLLVTHEPVTLAVLRSLLCAGATTASLLWLARSLQLSPWFAAAAGLAPQVWQFQRVLWDASFDIPVASLALAALAGYLGHPARWRLLLALGMTALLPLIHPQALPLFIPLAGALGWQCRAGLFQHRWAVAGVVGAILALNAVYLWETAWAVAGRLGGAIESGYPRGASRWAAALAPLLGGNLLSDYRFTGTLVAPGAFPALTVVAATLSRLVYPLAWLGIGVVAWRQLRPEASSAAMHHDPRALRQTVGRLLLITLALQALIFGLMRVPSEPQYFFGTFPVHVLLPWLALTAIPWRKTAAALVGTYAAAVAYLTFDGMLSIHRHGYQSMPPWPTLSNQVEIARALNQFSDRSASTDVPLYRIYPQALRALRLLIPNQADQPSRASGKLFIREFRDHGASRGRLELVETDAPPANAAPVDLTPLPKGWHPE
jgi:hypothetical protein